MNKKKRDCLITSEPCQSKVKGSTKKWNYLDLFELNRCHVSLSLNAKSALIISNYY